MVQASNHLLLLLLSFFFLRKIATPFETGNYWLGPVTGYRWIKNNLFFPFYLVSYDVTIHTIMYLIFFFNIMFYVFNIFFYLINYSKIYCESGPTKNFSFGSEQARSYSKRHPRKFICLEDDEIRNDRPPSSTHLIHFGRRTNFRLGRHLWCQFDLFQD